MLITKEWNYLRVNPNTFSLPFSILKATAWQVLALDFWQNQKESESEKGQNVEQEICFDGSNHTYRVIAKSGDKG